MKSTMFCGFAQGKKLNEAFFPFVESCFFLVSSVMSNVFLSCLCLAPVPSHRRLRLHQLRHRSRRPRRPKESLQSVSPPAATRWTRPVFTQSPTMWRRGTACVKRVWAWPRSRICMKRARPCVLSSRSVIDLHAAPHCSEVSPVAAGRSRCSDWPAGCVALLHRCSLDTHVQR